MKGQEPRGKLPQTRGDAQRTVLSTLKSDAHAQVGDHRSRLMKWNWALGPFLMDGRTSLRK